jgi:hypothetical protein
MGVDLNTHFQFAIEYQETPHHRYRVVGVSVTAESRRVKLDVNGESESCYDSNATPVRIEQAYDKEKERTPEELEIIYSYSVEWVPSNMKLGSQRALELRKDSLAWPHAEFYPYIQLALTTFRRHLQVHLL